MAPETTLPAPRVMTAEGLGDLYRVLVAEGYRVIGPAVQDGAIVLRELSSATELPFGWGVRLSPGGYQLRRRDDTAAFGSFGRAAELEAVPASAAGAAVVGGAYPGRRLRAVRRSRR